MAAIPPVCNFNQDARAFKLKGVDGKTYDFNDIKDAPERLVNRLKHYFLTYKQIPGGEHTECEITHVYGAEEAKKVVQLSIEDYKDEFPE